MIFASIMPENLENMILCSHYRPRALVFVSDHDLHGSLIHGEILDRIHAFPERDKIAELVARTGCKALLPIHTMSIAMFPEVFRELAPNHPETESMAVIFFRGKIVCTVTGIRKLQDITEAMNSLKIVQIRPARSPLK
jgi:hypothetical protein